MSPPFMRNKWMNHRKDFRILIHIGSRAWFLFKSSKMAELSYFNFMDLNATPYVVSRSFLIVVRVWMRILKSFLWSIHLFLMKGGDIRPTTIRPMSPPFMRNKLLLSISPYWGVDPIAIAWEELGGFSRYGSHVSSFTASMGTNCDLTRYLMVIR